MSFRRCLSGGGDIFSKSVERQGGANRTFKASGCCHGWQLEPCPYGLEPLLTFRKKIPTGRPHIEEGHSVRRGRSWGLRQPYVTNHAPRFINVSQKALHIYEFTAVECVRWTHGIKIERNNLLCEQAPTEVFRSIFAWLVTLNLLNHSI